MENIIDDLKPKVYKFGVIYSIVLVLIAAITNYFTWDIQNESEILNSLIVVFGVVLWIALYIPMPVFMIKAKWKISDFGFVLNKSTLIVSLILSLFLTIRLAGTFKLEYFTISIVETFARVGEELFFRGFIFTLAVKMLGKKENAKLWAVLISSLMFTVVHTQTFLPTNQLTMIDIFLSSLMICVFVYFTGSILPGIILHLAGNAGTLGMLLGIVLYGLFIIIAYIFNKSNDGNKNEIEFENRSDNDENRYANTD